MTEFKSAVCRVCGKTELCHSNPSGITFLPRDWIKFEDKTLNRRSAMASVCSEKCIRRLKELNRDANNKRTGW